MQINRQNYEAYFLDYIEGKLNTAEVGCLLDFIASNPDLKAELDNYESVTLIPESSIFVEKELLRKNSIGIQSVNESNFDEICVNRIEGSLDKNIEILFETYLKQHPGKLKEYNQYLKTILEPDKKIVFDEKRKLKHLKINRQKAILYSTLAAAASIIILILVAYQLYFVSSETKNKAFSNVAQNGSTFSQKKEIKMEVIGKFEKPIQQISSNQQKIKRNIKIIQRNEQIKKQNIQLQLQSRIDVSQLKTTVLQVTPVLSENIKRAAIQEASKSDSAREQKYLTINKLAKDAIDRAIKNENLSNDKGLNFWALAKSGIKEFNKLTGSKIVLDKTQDTTSNRSRIEIDAGLLGYYSSSEK
jgi:hypothetical protein